MKHNYDLFFQRNERDTDKRTDAVARFKAICRLSLQIKVVHSKKEIWKKIADCSHPRLTK